MVKVKFMKVVNRNNVVVSMMEECEQELWKRGLLLVGE